MKVSRWANLILLLCSSCFCLWLLEFSLYVLGSSPGSSTDEEFDSRSKLEVYDSLNQVNPNSVNLLVTPSMLIAEANRQSIKQPLTGEANRRSIACNESGQYVLFQSDRHGFRNSNSIWDTSDDTWVLVGDSYVQGWCVNEGESLSGQLTRLSERAVLNLGQGGSGPLMELAILTEFGFQAKPRKVLWFYCEGNDLITELQTELASPTLRSYFNDEYTRNLFDDAAKDQEFVREYVKEMIEVERLRVSGEFRREVIKFLKLGRIREALGIVRQSNLDPIDYSKVSLDDEFFEILTKAFKRVRDSGSDFHFIYLPTYSRYAQTNVDHDSFRSKKELLDKVEALGIDTLDIHDLVFADNEDPLGLFPFRRRNHYTPEGFRLIAEALYKDINSAPKLDSVSQ